MEDERPGGWPVMDSSPLYNERPPSKDALLYKAILGDELRGQLPHLRHTLQSARGRGFMQALTAVLNGVRCMGCLLPVSRDGTPCWPTQRLHGASIAVIPSVIPGTVPGQTPSQDGQGHPFPNSNSIPQRGSKVTEKLSGTSPCPGEETMTKL